MVSLAMCQEPKCAELGLVAGTKEDELVEEWHGTSLVMAKEDSQTVVKDDGISGLHFSDFGSEDG